MWYFILIALVIFFFGLMATAIITFPAILQARRLYKELDELHFRHVKEIIVCTDRYVVWFIADDEFAVDRDEYLFKGLIYDLNPLNYYWRRKYVEYFRNRFPDLYDQIKNKKRI